MRWTKNDVQEGMFVTSTAGERVGKVIRRDNETFVVEKGMLFPKDYELRYDHISDIKNGGIIYLLTEDSAQAGRREEAETAARAEAASAAAAATATATATAKAARETDQEVHIPLLAEELDVETFERESGHVKIHKAVKTEERRFSVPLRREEVVIEHISAANREGPLEGEGAFQEQMLDIPLHEEDVRVGKHAVLREEVVVRRVARTIEKESAASLRSEDLEIEDTRPRAAPSPANANGYGAPGRR